MSRSRPRILIAYYSRSGGTAAVARRIAEQWTGDVVEVEEIRDRVDRKGLLGWLRCAWDGIMARKASIVISQADVATYDLIVVGTPVWASSLSSPARAFLANTRGKARCVAFFLTHGGSGSDRVFTQMAAEVAQRPEATLAVTEREIAAGAHKSRAHEFAAQLQAGVQAASSLHDWQVDAAEDDPALTSEAAIRA